MPLSVEPAIEFRGVGRKIGEHRLAIYIGRLPRRKQVCLYTMNDYVMNVHAYFRSEEEAKTFISYLELVSFGRTTPDGLPPDNMNEW